MGSAEHAVGSPSEHIINPEQSHEPELDYGSSDPEQERKQPPPAGATNGRGPAAAGAGAEPEGGNATNQGGRKRPRIQWPGNLEVKKNATGSKDKDDQNGKHSGKDRHRKHSRRT